MKKIIFFLLLVNYGFSQDLNSYKYALIPSKFSFQSEKGQYNLNNLTRMTLEKNGFEVYLDDEKLSDDFAKNNCNKVFVDLEIKNTMFATKLKIVLKDCKNNIVFISEEGKSLDKNQTIAYSQALKIASQSLDLINHQYKPSQKSLGIIGEPVFQTDRSSGQKPIILIAKKTDFGFNLVSANPETSYMNLKATSIKDVFIADRQSIQGILFKSDDKWFFEFYQNNEKTTELIVVSF